MYYITRRAMEEDKLKRWTPARTLTPSGCAGGGGDDRPVKGSSPDGVDRDGSCGRKRKNCFEEPEQVR